MSISNRASETLAIQSPMVEAFMGTLGKLHHPEFNPTGALNLGVAHNDLLQQKIYQKAKECLDLSPGDLDYGPADGSQRLRQLLQDFFTRHFNPYYPIHWNQISAQTGAGASLNQIFMVVSDPGDYCLIPTPFYGAFDYDVPVNTGVNIYPVYLHYPNLSNMTVDPDLLESQYQTAKSEGKKITSMIITNPENPLGRCYSRQDIITFLNFASKHNIHMVFDEIYALSTFSHLLDEKKEDPFVSVLSLPYKDFIDPALVHVIYGLSKDFAVNGFRVGFILDQFNEPLRKALGRAAHFSYTSSITERLVYNLFLDSKWIDEYLLENRIALANSYNKTTQFLRAHEIDYIEAEASPFMLLDVRKFTKPTIESNKLLWKNLLDAGVYLAQGIAFHTPEPGYLRLTFALPWSVLEVGLNRFVKELKH